MAFTSRLGRTINPNKKVRVYRNLHRSGANGEPIYSVLQDGLVVGYVEAINLTDAKFIVNPAGRDSVRRTGKKVVHAYVEGRPAMYYLSLSMYEDMTVYSARYNPKVNDTFVDRTTGAALESASLAHVGPYGVTYAK